LGEFSCWGANCASPASAAEERSAEQGAAWRQTPGTRVAAAGGAEAIRSKAGSAQTAGAAEHGRTAGAKTGCSENDARAGCFKGDATQ